MIASARGRLLPNLKDAASIRWGPARAYQLENGTKLVCVSYNAKNSYGAYVGSTTFAAYLDQKGIFRTDFEDGHFTDGCVSAKSGYVEHWDIYLSRRE